MAKQQVHDSEELFTEGEVARARRAGTPKLDGPMVEQLFEEYRLDVALSALQEVVGDVNRQNGWRDRETPLIARLALMHTEISEAVEAVREGRPESEKIPGFEHVTEELADEVIRAFELADAHDLDLIGAIEAKLAHNAGRDYRHGGKDL